MLNEARQLVEHLETMSTLISTNRPGRKMQLQEMMANDVLPLARRLYMLLAMDDEEEFTRLDDEYMQMHHDYLEAQSRDYDGVPEELRRTFHG